MHVEYNENLLLLMPCFADKLFSTKLVSVFPGNKDLGKPVIYGSVVLNDGITGDPLALLNGSKLTALRTGAVGALGLAYTSPRNIHRLGLVGAGVQGFHQVLFCCAIREIKKVFIYDPYNKDLIQFIDELKTYLPDVEFLLSNDPEGLVSNSEAIITATTSLTPVLPDDSDLYQNKSIIGIGSFKPQMQELPDSLFPNLENVFVDTLHAKMESGDLSIRLDSGIINEDQINTLGKLINKQLKIDENQTTFFKSVGMALFDLMVAKRIYQNATKKGIGREVDF
jgi:ornithine cyclodeaminase